MPADVFQAIHGIFEINIKILSVCRVQMRNSLHEPPVSSVMLVEALQQAKVNIVGSLQGAALNATALTLGQLCRCLQLNSSSLQQMGEARELDCSSIAHGSLHLQKKVSKIPDSDNCN